MLCLLQLVDWAEGFSSSLKKNTKITKTKNPTNQKLIENVADAHEQWQNGKNSINKWKKINKWQCETKLWFYGKQASTMT